MRTIGQLIGRTLRARTDEAELTAVRNDVATLLAEFTPYPWTASGRSPPCPISG